MRHLVLLLAAALVAFSAAPTLGEEPDNVELFYPLTLRRPVFETLLDFTVRHAKGGAGRETEPAAELEYRALPWWKISLEVPVLIANPGRGTTLGGMGDIAIENGFVLFQSIARQAEITGGFELKLPSGSKTLGGETAIEPFFGRRRQIRKISPDRRCRL
jgi:hypothetical protein